MAKGLAVISGSDKVVFKALENGNITLGQDIAANVVVSGSLKLEISGYGADKFLMSDASGNASWVTIQASQVATSNGSDVQTAIDNLEANIGGDLTSLETRLSQEESRAVAAEGSLDSKISTEIDALISGAPALLDTLDELAAALGDDENFAVTIANSFASVTTRMSSEESTRASADSSLEARLSNEEDAGNSLELRVSNEEVARADGDSSLTTRIAAEETARASGDASLATALSEEASVRASADASIVVELDAEESSRISGDLSLTERVSAEESARASADVSLESRLSAEESARASGDASVAADLSAEESRAQSVEASLEARITGDGGDNLSAAKSYTDAQISSLVDAAPTTLDTLNELAAAINDNPSFAADLLADVASVSNRIAAEETARASADTSLEARLSGEEDANDSLELRVSNEEVARADADGSLTSRISSEEVARAAADTSLEGRLSSEESARASAIDDLADNTITFQGTANEVEIVSGGVVTLGNASSTVVLGLPDDVVISSSLNVTGTTTLGVGPIDDQLTINSKMRITHVDRTAHAAVLTEYSDTAALAAGDFDGHMFYLKGDNVTTGMFQQGNKWYFCENGVWHSSFFYVGS